MGLILMIQIDVTVEGSAWVLSFAYFKTSVGMVKKTIELINFGSYLAIDIEVDLLSIYLLAFGLQSLVSRRICQSSYSGRRYQDCVVESKFVLARIPIASRRTNNSEGCDNQ
mmetsp:Transcript_52631/g.127552  ORF Transcript_52631/g.127552 Transcript_52631/m.127552 type:complete len:112 (-) Transcript_52631:1547-1882(-)